MLRKALLALLVAAGIAGLDGCGSTANRYVYATVPDANQLVAFREDPNSGVLTQVSGSPYTAGDGANSVVVHPSGKFLYASNPGQNENDISLFSIAGNGTLSEVFPRVSVAPLASGPQFMKVDPAGAFLYVANAGSSNISVFSIDGGSGVLTPVSGSPFAVGSSLLNLQLTPSGNFLFITTPGSTSSGFVAGFSVTAGVLQAVSITPTDGSNPSGLAIDPTGTHLYTANSTSNSISIFSMDSSGGLTKITGSPINDQYLNPLSLLFDPAGSFLYVANQGSSNVAVYSIGSDGLPTILTTSTTTGAFGTEGSPSVLAFDPSGKYLFVGNQGSGAGVQVFSVSSGNLTALSTYTAGNTVSSIAVLEK